MIKLVLIIVGMVIGAVGGTIGVLLWVYNKIMKGM